MNPLHFSLREEVQPYELDDATSLPPTCFFSLSSILVSTGDKYVLLGCARSFSVSTFLQAFFFVCFLSSLRQLLNFI